jgi:epoxyqueuosine reductase
MLSPLKLALEAQGLVFLGISRPEYPLAYERFQQWLTESKHGGMTWLEDHPQIRKDPASLLPNARSVALFALPYYQDPTDHSPQIARYARFQDYHKILRAKAADAVEAWKLAHPREFEYRVAVDSAPVLERALFAKAPSVFVGKNTCLIHAERGSFLLLGEIFLTLDLPAEGLAEFDSTIREGGLGCGPCRSCQVACPTGALDTDFQIDAKKCLAYWTIEHRGTIPRTYWKWLGEYWFGCDLCQTACPYNAKAKENRLPLSIVPRRFPDIAVVALMTQAEYEQFFGGTPLTRAKRSGLRRNALIAMAVTRHPRMTEVLDSLEGETDGILVETASEVRDYLIHRDCLPPEKQTTDSAAPA